MSSSKLLLPPGAFRLLLAGVVVLSHLSRLDIGGLAVLLFFYLSGFWVWKIYRREFEGRRWGAFYASRWLRIAPLYFIVMTAGALLLKQAVGWESFSIVGIASAPPSHPDTTGVSWSLDIELQFYLLLPLLFAVVADRRLLLPVAAVLTATGWWLHFRCGVETVFMYLPPFALGAMTERANWTPSHRAALVSLAAFCGVTLLIAATPLTAPFLDKRAPHPFDGHAFGMIWMLPLLPYVARSLMIKSTPLDRDMGNWSYPLYLLHAPCIAVFVTHGASKWAAAAVAFALALALFYGPDRFFERTRRSLITRTNPQRAMALGAST